MPLTSFCPECRAGIGSEHGPGCPAVVRMVPFAVQQWMFEALKGGATRTAIDLLGNHNEVIVNTAQDRHAEGFIQYGDEMYHWTPEERLKNVIEELADAITYLTSGPIG